MRYTEFSTLTESVDINSIAAELEFLPTKKIPKKYKWIENVELDRMPPMSYTRSKTTQRIVTVTSDGKETENTAKPDDVIVSGPSQEKYVLTDDKFNKLYTVDKNGTAVPEQSPRYVAHYQGPNTVKFRASWGEDMILKPGDYLVKEPDGKGYYRIAAAEYEKTYNPPGH